ncbi:phage antirepressor KilAC domain-containing protein [Streptomyces sp. 5-6(2022)]|uniref:phage antirepressor KilAC domain-containing protein n=1 Tax=Streptomyces sp. 5-6(2022) TaxID=2936510 RepID=UPI0023B93E36|nr:phage antirepressor KilAC domain-containing protein [Streptomyces sp. 5-6(2022)]
MAQANPNLPAPDRATGGYDIGSFMFHGDSVTVLTNEHGNWAVLGQLCANLTLDAESQRQMILRKSWSAGRACMTQVRLPGDDRSRTHFLVHERIVPMWLANVTASRIQDDSTRAKIELAQLELADALYQYVTANRPFREPSKLEMARDLVSALEAKEALEAANKVLAPKAGKWDRFLSAEGLIGMREIADLFQMDVRKLTGWLVSRGMFRKQTSRFGGNRNLPRKMYQDSGHFVVKMETENGFNFPVAYATSEGLDLLDDLRSRETAA